MLALKGLVLGTSQAQIQLQGTLATYEDGRNMHISLLTRVRRVAKHQIASK